MQNEPDAAGGEKRLPERRQHATGRTAVPHDPVGCITILVAKLTGIG
jgi:hypothetical protein